MFSELGLLKLLDGLADVAKAIREHTAEMRESEARINAVGAKRQAKDHAHLSEMEANTERRQIESEGRADQRFAAMEQRISGGGY